MRRAHLIALLLAVAAVAAGVAIAGPSQARSTYRVDVVFDDARGLIAGQLVQVAGARVGKIRAVTLTPGFKARLHLDVDRRFAPFRADARCTIKPQGLIAENYVECDPGSPDARPLARRDGHAPTVPVERTTQPVALTDLFEIWNAPTRDRLQILLSTLGIATAGRGEDLNAILRRANPTLALARRTIGILERQRDDLATIVDASGEVADGLARRPRDLTRLVDRAAKVTTKTAAERAALGEGLRRLPALLREATPSLQKLDATMAAGRPLLEQLTAAAPGVNAVSADVPRLAEVARPALARLGPVLRDGAVTARRAAPLINVVQQYAHSSLPSSQTAGVLFKTLEDRGFVKTFLEFLYNGAAASARYDGSGHILPAHVLFTPCGMYATTPVKGCGSSFEPKARTRARRDDGRAGGKAPARDEPAPAGAPAAPAPAARAPAAPAPAGPTPQTSQAPQLPVPALPDADEAAETTGNAVDDLLDFLLR